MPDRQPHSICQRGYGDRVMRLEDMKKVLEIGVKLSSERDLERLLEEILSCVMDAGAGPVRRGDAVSAGRRCAAFPDFPQ